MACGKTKCLVVRYQSPLWLGDIENPCVLTSCGNVVSAPRYRSERVPVGSGGLKNVMGKLQVTNTFSSAGSCSVRVRGSCSLAAGHAAGLGREEKRFGGAFGGA